MRMTSEQKAFVKGAECAIHLLKQMTRSTRQDTWSKVWFYEFNDYDVANAMTLVREEAERNGR